MPSSTERSYVVLSQAHRRKDGAPARNHIAISDDRCSCGADSGGLPAAGTPEDSGPAAIERVFVIRIDAFDWNCPQPITPRFTTEEIQDALAPFEQQLRKLEQENERLRKQLAQGGATGKGDRQ